MAIPKNICIDCGKLTQGLRCVKCHFKNIQPETAKGIRVGKIRTVVYYRREKV